jgi:hypothetical protein
MRPDTRRHFGILLLVLVGLGLAAFAAINFLHLRPGTGKPPGLGGITVKKITLNAAPPQVRDAALKLATSRVAYTIPQGNVTYMIISTGTMGEPIDLAGASRSGSLINVDVRTAGSGDRLIIAAMTAAVTDTRTVQYHLDQAANIPALINTDNLPLVALPDKGVLVIVSPTAGDKVGSGTVQITGYARVFEGQFTAAITAAGKGRVLGELRKGIAATAAPNWGSFKINVPYTAVSGITDGVVVVYDEESSGKATVQVRFPE